MQEQNFADEIYRLFKSKRRTALRCNDLVDAYKKQYGRSLNTTELRDLPFIQFEKGGGNNNMIFLVVELDDCCNKCKFRYCKLLHSVDQNDKFILIYRHTSDKKENESNDSQSKDNSNKSKKSYKHIERPNIRLIQRVKDILNESKSNPKQITLKAMQKRHNQKFPHFKSHQPTHHGIAIRFKSTFHIGFVEQIKDHRITFKHDQNHQNLSSQYKNQSRYNSNNRNGGYHSINLNNTNSSSNYKKSNVIINSKKSHQSPWQKKTKPKPTNEQKNNPQSHPQPQPQPQPNQSPPSINNESQLSSSSNANVEFEDIITNNGCDIRPNNDIPTVPMPTKIIPEQPNKHYLSIGISPEWNDSKLIPDLVRHISQHTGKHIGDAYISNRIRLGFFTAKTQSIATQFIKNTRDHRVKCWGRTVTADIIPLPTNSHHGSLQRQQNGYRVKIQNVNCIMGRRDFENWVYKTTNCLRRRHLIYDIEIVFPKIQRGSHQCIMLFDKGEDTKYVVDKIQNVQFRGLPLLFKYWKHPNYTAPKVIKQTKKVSKPIKPNKMSMSISQIVHKNKIKKSASSSKPQTSIWAKMATQRKQKKLQKHKQNDKSHQEKPILAKQLSSNSGDAASTKSTKSAKSCSPTKPLQPTKPPKKSVNNMAKIVNSNVLLVEDSQDTPVIHVEKTETRSDVSVSNIKPRVPPLINSINRFRNDSKSISPTVEHSTQTAHTQNDNDNNEQEKPEPEAESEPEEEIEQPEGELIEHKEDDGKLVENDDDDDKHAAVPPPTQLQSQPQIQHTAAAASQPMQMPSNNVNLLSSASASLLAAQRQFNQLSSGQIQMNPMYLQQIQQLQAQQLQQQQQIGQPIRIVPINHLQQIQQLQQLQAQQYQMNMNQLPNINMNGINTLPNIYHPSYQLQNIPNINMPSYISSMHPPPPSSFNNIQFTPTPNTNTPPQNNSNNNPTFTPPTQQQHQQHQQQQQKSRINTYQSPPRHQSFQNNNRNNNNNNKPTPPPVPSTNSNTDNSTKSNEKNETNPPPKQTNPWDRLCKFCLLAEHEPSKCVWFNPNTHK